MKGIYFGSEAALLKQRTVCNSLEESKRWEKVKTTFV